MASNTIDQVEDHVTLIQVTLVDLQRNPNMEPFGGLLRTRAAIYRGLRLRSALTLRKVDG